MKKIVVSCLSISLVLTAPLSAAAPIIKQKSVDRVYGPLEVRGTVLSENTNTLRASGYQKTSNQDLSKRQKVSLRDVILQTVANSDIVKSQREKVIQAQLKLDDAIADYYPTLKFEYVYGKTRKHPGTKDAFYKYYNDRSYNLVLTQNLYAGGATNTLIKNIRKLLLVERNKYKIKVEEEINKAINAYFDVVFNKKAVEVNSRNMKKLEKVLEIVTIKYENEASSIGDLTSIKANVANAKTKLIKDSSNLQESLKYYEYVVGNEFSKTLPFEDSFKIDVAKFDILYKRALEQNPNLKNYYLNIEAEKHKIDNAKSNFRPKLDFELSYDTIMDKDNFADKETELNGEFRLTYNLYNGGKDKNKILKSYSALRDLRFRLSEESKKLKWNLSKLHNSITTVKEALKSTKTEVSSSREAVNAYWDSFQLGEQDLNVLLQGQRQLNSAEKELINFQRSNIKDYFLVLGTTGDLLAYFDIDPENDKFIDFSKSNYNSDLIKAQKEETDLLKKNLEAKKKEQEKIEVKKEIVKESINDNINSFIKEFLEANEDEYTLNITSFENFYKAFEFIKTAQIDKESFSYDVIDNYKIKTNIAYKIFKDLDEAKKEQEKLAKEFENNSIEVKKVKDIKLLYAKYLEGLEIKVKPVKEPKPKIKIIEKIQVIKKDKKFRTNAEFKDKFLKANEDKYTINIATFTNMEKAGTFVKDEEIYKNSIVFKYIQGKDLSKVMYGIFDTYDEAKLALDSLLDIKESYYPIIEKIGPQQKVYKANSQNRIDNKQIEYKFITKSRIIEDTSKKQKETTKEKPKEEVKKELKKEVKKVEKENNNFEQDINTELKKSFTKKEDKVLIDGKDLLKEEKTEEKVEEKKIKSTKKVENIQLENTQDFKTKFLSASKDKYSLNMATLANMKEANNFINKNNINENSFAFNFGKDEKFAKVMYGVFNSFNEAKEAILKLPENLSKNKPIVEKIYRKQDLYNKYNTLEEKNEFKTEVKEEIKKEEIKKEEPEKKQEIKKQEIKEEKIQKKELKEVPTKVINKANSKKEQIKEIKVQKKEELEAKEEVKKEEVKKEIKKPIIQENSIEEIELENPKSDKSINLSSKFTIFLMQINKDKVEWFIKRYSLDKSKLIQKESKANKVKLYYGVYETKEGALKQKESLHPILSQNNAVVESLGE